MKTNLNLNFSKIREPYEVINASVQYLRIHWKQLGKCLVVIALPFLLIGLIGYSLVSLSAFGSLDLSNPENLESLGSMSSAYIFMLLIMVGYIFSIATVYEYIMLQKQAEKNGEYEGPERLTVSVVSKSVFNKIGLYLGSTVILYLFLIPIAIVFVIIALSFAVNIFLGSILGFAGILYMYYLSVKISLVYIVRRVENKQFMEASGKSFYLIYQKFWETLWLYILCVVIMGSLSLIPNLISGGVTMAITLLKWDSLNILLVAVQAFYTIVSLFCLAFIIIASTFHYFSLVEFKENKELKERINLMGTTIEI